MQINKPKWDAWKMLPEAVRSGDVAFALAHGGLDMHQVCFAAAFGDTQRPGHWLCLDEDALIAIDLHMVRESEPDSM
jgi:hypothetical protein